MSATGRGSVRAPRDFYATPHWCVRALLRQLAALRNTPPPGKWLDPCAGNGDIISAVNGSLLYRPGALVWSAQDVAPLAAEIQALKFQQDAFSESALTYWRANRPDVIITNPPFKHAEAFIKAYRELSTTSIWLLRLNFLGSLRRANWFNSDMPNVYVLPKRPSFKEDGSTDATEYAWFVWSGFKVPCGTIRVIPAEFCT